MFALPVTLVSVPKAEVLDSPARVAFASALIVTLTAPKVAVIPPTLATALPLTPTPPMADVPAKPVRVIGTEPSPNSS